MGRWRFRLLGLLLLGLGVAACSTTMTGRRQLTLIDDAKMDEMGLAAFASLKQQGELSQDVMVNDYVQCVATAILEVIPPGAGPKNGKWEALVFDDPTPNAFALPGGKIGVHTGMLDVATTPGQLAAVLGHEVGHVLLRHGNERMSQSILADSAVQAGSIAAGAAVPEYQDLIVGGLGVGAQYGVLLPFSRKHEVEADQVGQIFMAEAGFYPVEAITLWQKMAELGNEAPEQWQSTHPSDQTRIARLQRNLPRAMRDYETARAAGKDPVCVPPVVYE
ncbi:MAG: M48 family metallopeptidase [Myxococcales bacterium]|nr:M48 family metallopeptidase [Myxococcales bacterium]MDH3842840.1 M48 family metallopeptidase [Myxococcales bacterium]